MSEERLYRFAGMLSVVGMIVCTGWMFALLFGIIPVRCAHDGCRNHQMYASSYCRMHDPHRMKVKVGYDIVIGVD